eukprot:TRINITY_DN1382_c3_g1_i2.p1 TRINITY_DN1382_c3_g1~~TRINITY_DN1382_c3_g1_i2.p1  ORF type:complete len:732 (+),score=121.10 TRINITY_DN1382_c3_g1_i2:138-2333(+)
MVTANVNELPETHRLALVAFREHEGIPDGHDESELLRFLKACKFRVEAAVSRLQKTLAWRIASLPIGEAVDLPPLPQVLASLQEKKWFSMMCKPNSENRSVFYCPVKTLEMGPKAVPWKCKPPRCYGAPRILEQMCALFYLWEKAIAELGDDQPEDLVFMLNVKSVKRPPIALLQRCSMFLGAHYPGRIHKIIIYPAPPRIEHQIRGMLKFFDIGQVTESVPITCINSREALLREVGVATTEGPYLTWNDLPEDLQETHPLPCLGGAPRCVKDNPQPSGGHFVAAKTTGPFTTTPWYPDGVDACQISLEEELADFAAFVLPVPQEKARRLALRSGIQETLDSISPGATVKLVGPDAYGLIVGGDALQLAVDISDPNTAAAVLSKAGHQIIQTSHPAKVLAMSPCGCQIELLLGDLGVAARKIVPQVRQWLIEFAPGAATAYTVLRCILKQSRYTDESLGGLSSDALMMMVIHICRNIRHSHVIPNKKRQKKHNNSSKQLVGQDALFKASRTLNGERVVRGFLQYYGAGEFDFPTNAVDPSSHEPLAKMHPGAPAILCPVPGWNLAEGCTRMPLIQQQLLYCKTALLKADAKAATSALPPYNRTSHRTALSSVLCHDPFWKRKDERKGPSGPIPEPGRNIVDRMQGKWRDMRGLLWEVNGTKVRCGNMVEFLYTMAAPAWTDGVYLLGGNTSGPVGNCVEWDDGDVWMRDYQGETYPEEVPDHYTPWVELLA